MSVEGPPRTPTTRVGKYVLGGTLGRGNFAKVKHARNVRTGEEYAIKILNRDNVLRHGMVDQIKREIKTMKEIRHPNVVRIYEVMATRAKIYIVLELVDAGQLFDKIAKNGRLKEDEARKYFQQLMNAVDYCHSRGVYHRDLKPQNLLLDSRGVLKVSDFGFSAFSQQGQKDGGLLHTACGTPNYVAPEVLADKGYDGTSADIWSCGVILFVLVAGFLPFDHPNLMALYKKIQRAEFCFPSWFSTGLKTLIKSILDPNPTTRITISGIHQDDWFKKNYQPPNFGPKCEVNFHDVDASTSTSAQEDYITEGGQKKPASMNAFDLITGSEGFNLKNLFERRKSLMRPSETRFTSQYTAQEIASKIEDAAKSLNFAVRRSSYKIKLEGHRCGRKGHLSVATEVFEAAPSFQVVKLHKTNGDTLEFQEFYVNFVSGLKDIIWK